VIDVHTPILEIDVLPPHATAARVVGITEELTHADCRVRENDHERPIPGRLQRRIPGSLLIEWVHVNREG
jgi:hypothetical protein